MNARVSPTCRLCGRVLLSCSPRCFTCAAVADVVVQRPVVVRGLLPKSTTIEPSGLRPCVVDACGMWFAHGGVDARCPACGTWQYPFARAARDRAAAEKPKRRHPRWSKDEHSAGLSARGMRVIGFGEGSE